MALIAASGGSSHSPRATHGYSIDRSTVADSPRATHGYSTDRSAVADSPARDPRLFYRPLRGRGLACARLLRRDVTLFEGTSTVHDMTVAYGSNSATVENSHTAIV
ncbi:MAG: hypothetical protein IT175_04120 [Acidobacteria bacterium]|nr:hypothetical protein [Acidobacteriota bacterium]